MVKNKVSTSVNNEEWYQWPIWVAASPKHKLLIDLSPKSGLSIGYHIICQMLDVERVINGYKILARDLYQSCIAKVLDLGGGVINNPDYYRVKLVRNPYARAVSSYLHVTKHSEHGKEFSFYEFIQRIKKAGLKRADMHCCPQFKCNEKEDSFNLIIKLEEFQKGIDTLNYEGGFDIKLPTDLKFVDYHHVKENYDIGQYVGDIPYCELDRKSMPNYTCFYSDRLREDVYNLYKKDIETYEYTFEDFERFRKESIEIYK